MTFSCATDFYKYMSLKRLVVNTVNVENAIEILDHLVHKIIEIIKTIDITKIDEVENLYLAVAQLTQAASYKAAIAKMQGTKKSFDMILQSIGSDDVISVLIDSYENHPQHHLLHQVISKIDTLYKPTKEAWAALHLKMCVVNESIIIAQTTTKMLQSTVLLYLSHLKLKLESNGINPSELGEIHTKNPAYDKMITRYMIISQLNDRIQTQLSLSKKDVQEVKNDIVACIKNQPNWHERPFIQKLCDILSLGLIPLYRFFFSKEKKFQSNLIQKTEAFFLRMG